jgi:general secretion pathway protein L
VRLSLVPRATVQSLIDMLAACHGRPSLIEAETEDGPRAIRLAHEPVAGAMTRLTPRNAAIILASLAGLVIISPFLRQSFELAAANRELASLAPRMTEVNALRRRIQGAGAGGDAVAKENRRVGDMLEALAAITEILPDNSHLTEFTMRERKMTLKGESASAPHLISLLSADPRIRNPAFTDATTTAENGHNDVFAIRAELAN